MMIDKFRWHRIYIRIQIQMQCPISRLTCELHLQLKEIVLTHRSLATYTEEWGYR